MSRLHVRGLRGRLMIIAVVGATALTATLTTGFNIAVRAHLHAQANDLLKQRADAHVAALRLSHGRIDIGKSQLDDAARDQPFWVYQDGRAVERPSAIAPVQQAANAVAGASFQFKDVPSVGWRLYSDPIVDVAHGRRQVGTIVAAVSLHPFRHTADTALLASVLLAALILAAMIASTRLVLSGALGPIDRLTVAAAARSAHDLDARFDVGEPYDEVTRLAATFDQLLDRMSAVLRHERRFTGEVAHELRTPLAKVITKGDLALRRNRPPAEYRDAITSIVRNARAMQRTLETLLSTARVDATGVPGLGDAHEAALVTVRARSRAAERRGLRLEMTSAAGSLRAGAATEVIEQILAPVIDNGCRHASALVRVNLERVNGHVDVVVENDGDEIPAGDRERIFEPGVRLDRTGAHGGAGLGLALARRLARTAGGDVECLPSDAGARFRLRLPAA
jgi:signal transduction histidine kinase